MDYETLKQLRDSLVTQFDNSNLENITFLDSSALDALLYYIDEYQELTRRMLQHIKQLESPNKKQGSTSIKEQEDRNYEDRKWLEHFLSLGE